MAGRRSRELEFMNLGAVRRLAAVLAVATVGLAAPAAASAKGGDEEVLEPVSYPDMTTYSCRTGPLPVNSGQNVNAFTQTKTCPNAAVVSGTGSTDVFSSGSTAQGYITRFKPSMVEILDDGEVIPKVYDLHLHHVVWLKNNLGPTFASGEEKTEAKFPEGYGVSAGGDENWFLNHMIHNLTASGGRQVAITWEIDWVPAESASGQAMEDAEIKWMDVAGFPQAIYPVFDAERGFDQDGDGDWTFPDDVPSAPGQPGYEEREKISASSKWTVPSGGRDLLFTAGHLHPGGKSVDLTVARDGPDAGSEDGNIESEVKPLFKSRAKYYDPKGAVSWDLSMKGTRPEWRVSLKAGDTVSISVTYDVRKASWYESMGIMPLLITAADDPLARDPFDQAAEVKAMYDAGGILTHGRLKENIDRKARKNLGLPDPRKLKSSGRVPAGGINVNSFRYLQGGYSAFRNFATTPMRPPVFKDTNFGDGVGVSFTNLEALSTQTNEQQVWHSITSCRAPCNKGSGIGYPLANGPIKFDSGQLGFGNGASQDVTTGSNEWATPDLPEAGKTYTYFCRIHPFMRGSVRTKEKK